MHLQLPSHCLVLENRVLLMVSRFQKLRDHLISIGSDDADKLLHCIQKREEVCVDDCHCLATLLHPSYGQKYLTSEHMERGMDAMERLATRLQLPLNDVYLDYGLFQSRGGRFHFERTTAVINYMPAAVWWNAFHATSPLCKVRKKIILVVTFC
jgi:hypothetical protein